MRAFVFGVALGAGYAPVVLAQSQARADVSVSDSVVLQRTSCLGTCPAYRVSVRRDGFIRFVSHNRGDNGRVESHQRRSDVLRRIERELERVQYHALPDIVVGRGPYCRVVATDAPTITVSVFRSNATRVLSYYTGCMGASPQDSTVRPFVLRMRALADSIDAIAVGAGWIRPAACCDI